MSKLLPCPFCKQHLTIRKSVNPYGRCETKGCWMNEAKIAVPLDDEVQVSAFNTRPAHALCDELETILWGNSVALSRPHDPEVWNRTVASCPRPFYTVELVTRQNAEEVIAAKDARIAELNKECDHIADKNNAVVRMYDHVMNECAKLEEKYEALEADNKRLRGALIKISRGSYDGLEVTSLSAKQMKDIVNAALGEVKI